MKINVHQNTTWPYFKYLCVIQFACIIMDLYKVYYKGSIISILQKVKLRSERLSNISKASQKKPAKLRFKCKVVPF